MAAGNEVLARHHEKAKLVKGSDYSRRDFRIVLFAEMDKTPGQAVNVFGFLVPRRDVAVIQAVRNIQSRVLEAYSGILAKTANAVWRRERVPTKMEFGDFYNEGVLALTDAIYYYLDPAVQFSTYSQWVVYRQLTIAANFGRPLSHWSTRARKMVAAYETARNQFNGPVSFDQVVAKMGLTPQQAGILTDLMCRVLNESALETGNDDGDEMALASLVAEEGYVPDLDLQEALTSVRRSLKTQFEIDIYNCLLNDGNLTEVANAHGVTRQRAHQIAVRIRAAIKALYEPEEMAVA
jgi:hypothetical protein